MRKRCAFTFFGLGFLLIGLLDVGRAQQLTSLAEVAIGEGTLRLDNRESLSIKAVAVFLRENGQAEIWLSTGKDVVYAGGRWFRGSFASRAVDLRITDDTMGGCATGGGTVFLQDGCAPVARLTLTMSRLGGCRFEAEFVSERATLGPNPNKRSSQRIAPNRNKRPRSF